MRGKIFISILALLFFSIGIWNMVLLINIQVLKADIVRLQDNITERDIIIEQWASEYELLSKLYAQSQSEVASLGYEVDKLKQMLP